eukprot:4606065-Amphidinium_carterae.1
MVRRCSASGSPQLPLTAFSQCVWRGPVVNELRSFLILSQRRLFMPVHLPLSDQTSQSLHQGCGERRRMPLQLLRICISEVRRLRISRPTSTRIRPRGHDR